MDPYILSFGPGYLGIMELYFAASMAEVQGSQSISIKELLMKFSNTFSNAGAVVSPYQEDLSFFQVFPANLLFDTAASLKLQGIQPIKCFDPNPRAVESFNRAISELNENHSLTDYDLTDFITVGPGAMLPPSYDLDHIVNPQGVIEHTHIPSLEDWVSILGKPTGIVARSMIGYSNESVWANRTAAFFYWLTNLADGASVVLIESYHDLIENTQQMIGELRKIPANYFPYDFRREVAINDGHKDKMIDNPILGSRLEDIESVYNRVLISTGTGYKVELKTYDPPLFVLMKFEKPQESLVISRSLSEMQVSR